MRLSTGYGRIATMGKEIKKPESTIPKAIILTLIVSAIIYILVAVVALALLARINCQ